MSKLELDYRESCLIDILKTKSELKSILEVKNLDIGDIIITHKDYKLIIERKTINDLVSSVKDGRYKEQKMRLLSYQKKNPNTRIIYLIEGYELSSRLRHEQSALHGSLISMSLRDNIPIFRTKDVSNSVVLLLRLYSRMLKNAAELFPITSESSDSVKSISIGVKPNKAEQVSVNFIRDGDGAGNGDSNGNGDDKNIRLISIAGGGNNINKAGISSGTPKCYLDNIKIKKKDNITADNWFTLALANIPGVSVKIAKTITGKYAKLQDLMDAYSKLTEDNDKEKLLCDLPIIDANRKIGKVISKKVYEFMIHK